MSTPARGPQPILRADGTTAYSSGTVHTWCIRVAGLFRRPADMRTTDRAPAAESEPIPNAAYDLYRHALRAAGTRR